MLVKMRQRARSLDAFSHLYRDFQYRLISTYTFSESSCHSESNDMRQGYVLINRLGCRAPWRVRWRHPHVRGRKKFVLSSAALHPRYSYSGGSPALGTTGKFWYTFIENGTLGQVLDYSPIKLSLLFLAVKLITQHLTITWALHKVGCTKALTTDHMLTYKCLCMYIYLSLADT